MSSRTLTEAVQGLLGARAQIAVDGIVEEVRGDGSVYCRVKGEVRQVRVVTDQLLTAGMPVGLVKRGTGGGQAFTYTLLGGGY